MLTKPFHVFRFLTVLFICTFKCAGVMAATPAVHISAKPSWLKTYQLYNKKVPLRQVQNGFFYQLSEEQVQVEKQADYRHNIREIISEAGIQNGSEISVSFDPSYEQLDFHEIKVWRNNQAQSRLNASAFKVVADEQELSKFIYQGSYTAVCILNDIRKGDKIEYSYTITGRNPIYNNHFVKSLYFQGLQTIAQIYKSIQAAPTRKLYFKTFNQVPKAVTSTFNGLNCYEWQVQQAQPAQSYDNQPAWYDAYNNLQISDYQSWKEVLDWGMSINPLPATIGGALLKRIEQLKAAAGNDKEKYFRAAVKIVQDEVRYMGIEMGEYSHHAHRPEAVYNQRYGDCKDKALLLASILNANGIDASMMLVNSADSKIDRYLPSPGVFDHAVVAAVVKGKPVYVDATMAYQRGTGFNLYFPAYGKGLILKAGNSKLTTLPVTSSGQATCQEVFTIPGEKGKANLDVKTIYTLSEADRMRDKLASSSLSEVEQGYLNYYAKSYPKIESADTLTVHDDEIKNELTITEHYLITDLLKKDTAEGNYTASFYASTIDNQLLSVPVKVNTPVAVNFPGTVNHTIKIIMPNGWDIKDDHQSIKRNAYEFSSGTTVRGDTLSLNYHFNYLRDFIPVNELEQYRVDVKQLVNSELNYNITYTPDLKEAPFKPNYWLIAYAAVLIIGLGVIGFRIYCTETPGIIFAQGSTFVPLGGWLILVCIGLLATCCLNVYSLFDDKYFDIHKWNFYARAVTQSGFLPLICFEVTGHIICLCTTVFCLILLLNRRDILPRYIIGFYIVVVTYNMIDYVWTSSVLGEHEGDKLGTALFRSIIVAVIWINYFRRSERVEETFIVPYPSNNYTYEEQGYTAEHMSK